ncbi:stAR-related lipid transfer protein 6-like [Ptychodera flava]|uniref:stAR-related lipid transfer protein 6-like n=1 Tax=Ptychodera flava TaxID=63121 RepID=UPI00396A1620
MADFKAIADDCAASVLQYSEDNDWTVHKTTKNGRVSYKKSRDWDGYVYRCDFEVDTSPVNVLELITNIEKHLKWNKNMKEIFVLTSLSEDIQIRHSISPSAMMGLISPRDFCTVIGKVRYPDKNTSMVHYTSIEYDHCPETSKYVRGHNYPSGTVIRTAEGDPDKSIVVNITQFDAKLRPRSLAEKVYPSVLLEYSMYLKEGAKTLAEP